MRPCRRTCAPTFVALLLLVWAGAAAAQDFGAHLDRPTVEPFMFRRRTVPRQQFTTAQLEDWSRAVTAHRPGTRDDASARVSSLDPDALADIVAAFEWGAVAIPAGRNRIDATQRAVILHTDIAVMATAGAPETDRVNVLPLASLHFGAAMELVTFLKQESPKGKEDPFVAHWWKAVAAAIGQIHDTTAALYFIPKALSLFPRDPEILLISGAVWETQASPFAQDTRPGFEAEYLRRAERCYRGAIENDHGAVEARVRLARVLSRQGRHALALAALDEVRDEALPARLAYFKQLFVGEANEGARRMDAARAAYMRALQLFPGAQSAHLALARLERRTGDRAKSAATVQRLLERPLDEQARQDPSSDYLTSEPARRAGEILESLRQRIRSER